MKDEILHFILGTSYFIFQIFLVSFRPKERVPKLLKEIYYLKRIGTHIYMWVLEGEFDKKC